MNLILSKNINCIWGIEVCRGGTTCAARRDHTEGLNPTKDVDAAEIGRKLVDLTKMNERSPNEASAAAPEVREPPSGWVGIGWDLNRTVKVSSEIRKKPDSGKANQKSAEAIVGVVWEDTRWRAEHSGPIPQGRCPVDIEGREPLADGRLEPTATIDSKVSGL